MSCHTSLTVWRDAVRFLDNCDVLFGDFLKGVFSDFKCIISIQMQLKYNTSEYVYIKQYFSHMVLNLYWHRVKRAKLPRSCHEHIQGEKGIASLILNLGTRR